MTAARQCANAIVAALLIVAAAFAVPASALPLVVDAGTGLAMSGFDPVGYFADGKAEQGRAELELGAEGAVWRFRNEGDRAAFQEHPEVYRPAFGGYDPVAIARERSVPGHPLFWAIFGERLYLFYDAASRDSFLAQPAAVLSAANRTWPEVAKSVAR
jgi:hypothetical protein